MSVTERFDDRLEPLGVGLGALLVLIGLATIAGMPWATKGDLVASILQILGVFGTIGIGALLVWLSRTE